MGNLVPALRGERLTPNKTMKRELPTRHFFCLCKESPTTARRLRYDDIVSLHSRLSVVPNSQPSPSWISLIHGDPLYS